MTMKEAQNINRTNGRAFEGRSKKQFHDFCDPASKGNVPTSPHANVSRSLNEMFKLPVAGVHPDRVTGSTSSYLIQYACMVSIDFLFKFVLNEFDCRESHTKRADRDKLPDLK